MSGYKSFYRCWDQAQITHSRDFHKPQSSFLKVEFELHISSFTWAQTPAKYQSRIFYSNPAQVQLEAKSDRLGSIRLHTITFRFEYGIRKKEQW